MLNLNKLQLIAMACNKVISEFKMKELWIKATKWRSKVPLRRWRHQSLKQINFQLKILHQAKQQMSQHYKVTALLFNLQHHQLNQTQAWQRLTAPTTSQTPPSDLYRKMPRDHGFRKCIYTWCSEYSKSEICEI